MPRGRSKSRKNRKGNEEPQLPCSIECEEITPAAGKKKKDGPGSPGRAGGKVKHHQESGDTITPCESSAYPMKEDASPKKSNTSGRESDNNSVVGEEKSSITPRKKKGRRKSQEINLNESREKELLLLTEEILKEQVQVEGEKVQAQKQKKTKNEALNEICEKLEDSKKEKNVNKEQVETENSVEDSEQRKKNCSNDITIIQIVNKIVKEDKIEKEQNVDKDVSHSNPDPVVINNNLKEEKKEDTTLKAAAENWSVVSPKRQRKKQSQERVELPKTLSEAPNDKREILLLDKPHEKEGQKISSTQEDDKPSDTKTTPGEFEAIKKQDEEIVLSKECEKKLSVHEIKRKFCTETSKDLAPKTGPTEQGDERVENTPTCKSSKEKLNPDGEGDSLSPATASTTTEIFIAHAVDKESVSSSSLCRAESPTEILSDDGTVKLKAKILHGGLASDLGKALVTIEKDGSVFTRGSYEAPKISVKQLRERLISSCSKLNDKIDDKVITDPENKEDERSSSEERVIDKHAKGHEKKDYNVSLKERLESYRCQASKEFQFTSTDQDIPAGTSIKELQSSFDKMHQTNINLRVEDIKNKVKSVNDEIHHAQEYTMRCKACGKQVFLMERVMAEKSIWHKKCFRCSQCRRQLTVENYKSHDGVLYCQLHYDQILKPKRAEGAVSAHNTTVEEVNISPINVKSLFEKTVSTPAETSPTQAATFMPVEKSPRFLKRLRRFESKISDQSEEDEEKQRALDGTVPKVPPDKTNKMKDDIESNFETDFEDDDGVKSVKSNKDSGSSKKSTPTNSPRGKGKSLHGHLKQFFEKHDSEATTLPPPPIIRRDKKPSAKRTKSFLERLQGGDAPKKPEESSPPETQERMSKVPVEEGEATKLRSTNKESEIFETKDMGQIPDVHSVISYFNQQQ